MKNYTLMAAALLFVAAPMMGAEGAGANVLQNGNFEAAAFDAGWQNKNFSQAPGLNGTAKAAAIGSSAGTGHVGQSFAPLRDFELSFYFQLEDTKADRSLNLRISGGKKGGTIINLRLGQGGSLQLYHEGNWSDVAPAGTFQAAQAYRFALAGKNFGSGSGAQFDVRWSAAGKADFGGRAENLALFQSASIANREGVGQVQFSRATNSFDGFTVDEVVLTGTPLPGGAAPVVLDSQKPETSGDPARMYFVPAETEQCITNISGVYPHLTAYNQSPTSSYGEVGIGAVVPWAGKLWYLTYPPHLTRGSNDKLYSVDPDLHQTIHPESVGGTHACRMIHRESNQLIIGPYFISAEGKVRACDVKKQLVGRMTAVMRHLTDPANLVYFFDMEGAIYEVNVHTLDVKKLFGKPVPGWHGKGGYTSQGRIVIANNGEAAAGKTPAKFECELPPKSPEDAGVLAEWDGKTWRIVMRRQFTDITGPGGIMGAPEANSPLWAMGWDKRSVILQLLDQGQWHTFRVPKASHAFDARHGWYTEWPRIREINPGRFLMVMHGAMFDFPRTFSAAQTGGLRPLSQHLRYIPDFCFWNGRVVLASDETTVMDNKFAGQCQSDLWFGQPEDLAKFGTPYGFGGVWLGDEVKAGQTSDPFLVAGFEHRCLHLAAPGDHEASFDVELDEAGNNQWRKWKTVTVAAGGYQYEFLPATLKAEWLRVVARQAGQATAYLHQRQSPRYAPDAKADFFQGLARVTDKGAAFCAALLRPAAHNRNLMVLAKPEGAAGSEAYAEVDAKLAFNPLADAKRASEVRDICAVKSDFTVDAASVIVKSGKRTLRLPKGPAAFDAPPVPLRGVRECESERSMANFHGTFYEIPRAVPMTKEQPLDFYKLRPVASHDRLITDYCTWRGMLVLAGCLPKAPASANYLKAADGKLGLWFGAIDDLWKLGKPVGVGGPWQESTVKAGAPSDPYLMTGYDRKRVVLFHNASAPVTFKIEVDVANDEAWKPYAAIKIMPGQVVEYKFPDAYGAHWVRVTADTDCIATAQFHYE